MKKKEHGSISIWGFVRLVSPKEKVVVPRARVKVKDSPEEEKRVAIKTKIMVALFRHKEMLKKEILRKRALLEKELQCEIQVTVCTTLYLLFRQLEQLLLLKFIS